MADSIPSAKDSAPGEIALGPDSPALASRFGQAAFIFILSPFCWIFWPWA